MSKSNIAEPRPEILLFEHGTAAGLQHVARHTHPFWQFEMIRTGRADCTLGDKPLRLKANDLLLIPPETPHDFTYLRPSCSYLSIKFHLTAGATPTFEPKPLAQSAATTALRHALPLLTKSPAPLKTTHSIIHHLLSALLVEASHSVSREESPDFWVERARQLIAAAQGRKMTVASLAQHLGISTGYLAARFRAIEKISLKSYLDQQRAERALDLLRYSDLTIARIADALEFPDPFTFSRFVRKYSGTSPRKLIQRRKNSTP